MVYFCIYKERNFDTQANICVTVSMYFLVIMYTNRFVYNVVSTGRRAKTVFLNYFIYWHYCWRRRCYNAGSTCRINSFAIVKSAWFVKYIMCFLGLFFCSAEVEEAHDIFYKPCTLYNGQWFYQASWFCIAVPPTSTIVSLNKVV